MREMSVEFVLKTIIEIVIAIGMLGLVLNTWFEITYYIIGHIYVNEIVYYICMFSDPGFIHENGLVQIKEAEAKVLGIRQREFKQKDYLPQFRNNAELIMYKYLFLRFLMDDKHYVPRMHH